MSNSLLVLHLVSLSFLAAGIGGLAASALSSQSGSSRTSRKIFAALHGVGLLGLIGTGLFYLLVGEGGGNEPWPTWIYLKIGAWVALGGLGAVFKRKPQWAPAVLVVALFLIFAASYFGVFKSG